MAAVTIQILGPFEITVGGSAMSLGRPHRRSILALLSLRANDIVSVHDIVHALWGERPTARARNQVQVYISALRYQLDFIGLGRQVIQTHHVGYRLALPPGSRDVDTLDGHVVTARRLLNLGALDQAADHLRQALALFRGRPLDGVDADFARWEATLLEERRLALITDYARAQIARGFPESTLPDLFRHVRAHPAHEALREQLMVALHRSGRTTEALTVYRQGRQVLVDEFGVEPGHALRQAQAAILRG